MSFNIVLVQPVIPQNTGNIARLSAATSSQLHLIHPLGFELSDRYVKRAGLDYWPEVDLRNYSSWEEFLSQTGARDENMWFFSTKGSAGTGLGLMATKKIIDAHQGEISVKSEVNRGSEFIIRIPAGLKIEE